MKRTRRFRELLHSPELEFLLEAHNGLSARICEEAGFRGIWASGLCLSAQFGVRDCNEASWTQILEMLEFMADATTVPIMLDGDTGYGNFNNLRRLVKKLEQRGVAAVCIEDKLFPKSNSFIAGEKQPLADVDEFSGKIKAGKDAQDDDEFTIVARTEALIAGRGLAEALSRAEAYTAAGADAILIHSAKSTADEVLAFKKEWCDRSPVVIVPTKYYATPTDAFREAGFSIAIWANHLLRASVTSMQETANTLAREENLLSIEDRVAAVHEVFRLQGAPELREAERRFLPPAAAQARAVVLAASRGEELGELTAERPKAMVPVRGKPLLAHIVAAYQASGVRDIVVVRGYAKETIDLPEPRYVDNDEYRDTGELFSLRLALDELPSDDRTLVISYGDVLFNRYIVRSLLETEDELVVAVDTEWKVSANRESHADYAACSAPPSSVGAGLGSGWGADEGQVSLRRVSPDLEPEERHGEWMGFLKIGPGAVATLTREIDAILADGSQRRAGLPVLLNSLIESGRTVRVVYTSGHWLDVDRLVDVVHAGSF